MKNQAIVCIIGHFDNEIDIAPSSSQMGEIKPQVDQSSPEAKGSSSSPRGGW